VGASDAAAARAGAEAAGAAPRAGGRPRPPAAVACDPRPSGRAAGRVEHAVANGRKVCYPGSGKESVELHQQLAGRGGVFGERSERCPELTHRCGRVQPVADDIADG